MLWLLPTLPVVVGAALWWWDAPATRTPSRTQLGVAAVAALCGTLAGAIGAALTRPAASYAPGAGLVLRAEVDTVAAVTAVLVPAVAAIVVLWAAGHEERHGLGRLLGLLVAFVGAMELLVVAADLVTLLVGWELVGAASWALIGFAWSEPDKPAAAAHAFNATRFGDLGLFVAAGAAFAGTGSFMFAALPDLSGTALSVVVAGVLVAATGKSAQVCFAPWLFSAMGGPSSVSALLHSSTMVAAGAYLLIRLHPVLDAAAWFAPAAIAIGLSTALAGGVVAALQTHAKKLLAASTSAHYGLMFVAVGAGYPLAGLAHLVVHAVFKSHLFLAAGTAMEAAGSPQLGQMRLGRHLPGVARTTLVSALALAALVPLGGAWSKEQVVAAAGHAATWLAVATLMAGALSAVYATRFQVLAYGRTTRSSAADPGGHDPPPRIVTARPGIAERAALGVLALGSGVAGVLWLPPVEAAVAGLLPSGLPSGASWELVSSVLLAVFAIYATWNADRRGHLALVGLTGRSREAADWLGLPRMVERSVVRPTLLAAAASARLDDRIVDAGVRATAELARRTARILATGDDRIVDAGVRGAAALGNLGSRLAAAVAERGLEGAVAVLTAAVSGAGRDTRRLQTGMTHHYYVVIAAGLVLFVVVTAVWR